MFEALAGVLIFEALPTVALAYSIVWFFMKPNKDKRFESPKLVFLIGLSISLLGAAFIRLIAIFVFGIKTAFNPPAEDGVASFYLVLLPGLIGYSYIRWMMNVQVYDPLSSEETSRANLDDVNSGRTESNLSLSDRMVKKGAVGQTAKSCANVFKKIKSESTHMELNKVLSATLDFRYTAVPTKSNLARHQHLTQKVTNQISSRSSYGLKDLIVDILDQEMDIDGIKNDVEKVVIEVLRESGIDNTYIYGISNTEQNVFAQISDSNNTTPADQAITEVAQTGTMHRAFEVGGVKKDPSLWAKAMALAEEDKDRVKSQYQKAESQYIKLRVEQLAKEKR